MDDLILRLRRLRSFLLNSNEPVTRVLLFIEALLFLINLLFYLESGDLVRLFAFSTADVLGRPWGVLTYPLLTIDPLGLLFGGYWLWVVGGTLERSWGSNSYLKFLASVTLITALGLWLGSFLLAQLGLSFLGNTHAALSGLWMLLAALTVAWTLMNPEQVVLLGFILPIKGRYLMWITIGLAYILFAFAWQAPWLGFFSLAGVGYAYHFTGQKAAVPYVRAERVYRQGPPTPFERAADWARFYWRRWTRRFPRR